MLKTYVCRVAAGAVFSATVAAGSLGLTAAAVRVSAAASAASAGAGISTAINCPPPHPEVTALTGGISDC